MKEFDKWFYYQVCSKCDKIPWTNLDKKFGCGPCQMKSEQAWKAAVEWVEELFRLSPRKEYYIDILKQIRKELNDSEEIKC